MKAAVYYGPESSTSPMCQNPNPRRAPSRCASDSTACGYTAPDFAAVIELMARGMYDTTGGLHAGTKMKVLVDPSA